jgi:hypothetical protein
MEWIINWIRDNTAWLYTRIYENPIFFLDYWSFVHIYSGIGLFVLFTFLGIKHRWILLSIILLTYEVIEIVLVFFALHFFKPEIFKDQFTDIFIGYLGCFVGQFLLKEKNIFNSIFSKQIFYPRIVAGYTAVTIAFVWVGNYQYRYNQPFFNSSGLNWWAFLLWFVGLVIHFELYLFFKRFIPNVFLLLATSWLWFFAGLLVFEIFGFYILNIRNVSHGVNAPLILGLVHGTKVLYIFYLSAPFIGIAVFELFDKIFFVARQKEILRRT